MKSKLNTILAAGLLASAAYAADAVSDADERFRIKYGRNPPHLENSRNRAEDKFGKLDRDRDGRISRDEWSKQGRCSCQFEDRDSDRDGFINRIEWHADQAEKSGG